MAFEQHGHTHRLNWVDPTIREWDCSVVWSDPADPEAGIVLDRSAFYPGGGGQPPDHGVLIWQGVQTRIVDTRKSDDLYLVPAPGDPVPPGFKQALEDAVNAEIAADRKIVARVLPREEALAIPDLVRTQDALPPLEMPEIRVVDIVGLDVQADGGTHVASTAQVGHVVVQKVESKGRQNRRVRIKLSQ